MTFDPRTIQREVLEEFSDTSAFGLSGEDIEQMTLIFREEAILESKRESWRKRQSKKAPRGMKGCRGCGTPLPIKTGPGKPQDWCSDACRMRYNRTCSDIARH